MRGRLARCATCCVRDWSGAVRHLRSELLAVLLSAEEASAASLPASVASAVMSLVAERSAGVAPAAVAALARDGLRAMAMTKLKTALILLSLGLGAIGMTVVVRSQFSGAAPQTKPQHVPRPQAADPAEDTDKTWPVGVEVRGRVVDHRGNVVAGADVLLLGGERVTVYADPGPREGSVRHSISTDPAATPVRQDRRSGAVLVAAAEIRVDPSRRRLRPDAALGSDAERGS